jgi:hypothetical protein
MKEQKHAREIMCWANGAVIEYTMNNGKTWHITTPNWKAGMRYRVCPECEYALTMVPDGDLYKDWINGALMTQNVFGDFNHLNTRFIDACDTEDPFGTWMNEHNGTMTRTKKMVKQTRWINVSVISTATQDTIDGFCVTKRPLPYGTLEAHWAWITDGETPPTDWHQISADKREIEQ